MKQGSTCGKASFSGNNKCQVKASSGCRKSGKPATWDDLNNA